MNRGRGRVIAILDWRAAATLKDNATFLQRAGLLALGRSRRGVPSSEQRSLIVRADGSGELQRFTPTTAGRRLVAMTGRTYSTTERGSD